MTPLPDQGSNLHAELKDPDGILLELVEAPELVPGERPARIVGLRMTSSDIATKIEDMCDGFGFSLFEDLFQHRTYWQEGGLEWEQTLQLDDMYLVVSQYRNNRPRRSGHQLADIGIMNFAVWLPSQADFQSCYQRIMATISGGFYCSNVVRKSPAAALPRFPACRVVSSGYYRPPSHSESCCRQIARY